MLTHHHHPEPNIYLRVHAWWCGEPEIGPYKYHQPILNTGTKQHSGANSLFPKWCRNNWTSTCKNMDLDTELMAFIKISSKWVRDLNVKDEIIKLLEKP